MGIEKKKIEKKIWPKFFEKIKSGEKTFEVRLVDTDYKVGDVMVLKEWNPDKNEYTGREIRKTITYVAFTKNMRYWSDEEIAAKGFTIIGFH